MLHTAHSELEKLVIAARSRAAHARHGAGPTPISSTTASGISPTREAIDAFVATIQPRVTGAVRLKLFKGDCRVVGRKSPFGLYEHDLATYDAGDLYDHGAAEGFIKIWGLPVETAARKAAARSESVGH